MKKSSYMLRAKSVKKMSEPKNICACGSGMMYEKCCGPYHRGQKAAPTAVALMRSRYAAFIYGKIDYLVSTTLPVKRTADLEEQYRSVCASTRWIDLEVIGTSAGDPSDKIGRVEFKVSYSESGRIKVYHECSRFRRKGGKWYYVDAVVDDCF